MAFATVLQDSAQNCNKKSSSKANTAADRSKSSPSILTKVMA